MSSASSRRWRPSPAGSSPGQRLLDELHGFDKYISGRTVDVHVMNLRKKIERAPRRPSRLLTVFGVGYKLTDPAKNVRHASS